MVEYLSSTQFALNKYIKHDIYRQVCSAINLSCALKEINIKKFQRSSIYHRIY